MVSKICTVWDCNLTSARCRWTIDENMIKDDRMYLIVEQAANHMIRLRSRCVAQKYGANQPGSWATHERFYSRDNVRLDLAFRPEVDHSISPI